MGKTTAGILSLLLLIGLVLSVKSAFSYGDGIASGRARIFVDSTTNQSFELPVTPGMAIPVKSPYSGQNTGYEYDEMCTWTADGHVADHPTYVLLNRTLHKTGPTFCPDCGRLVVENNPPAEPGAKVPPTKSEYSQMKR